MKSNQIQPPTPAPFQNLSQLGIETLQLSKLYYYAFFYNISSFWVSGVTYIRRVSSARTLQKGYLPQLKNINKCLPKFAFYPNNTASRFYFAPFSLKRASGQERNAQKSRVCNAGVRLLCVATKIFALTASQQDFLGWDFSVITQIINIQLMLFWPVCTIKTE